MCGAAAAGLRHGPDDGYFLRHRGPARGGGGAAGLRCGRGCCACSRPRDGYDGADTGERAPDGLAVVPGVYLALLVLVHHAAFFLLELGSFRHFGYTTGEGAGVELRLFTDALALLIVQLLFFPARRGPSDQSYGVAARDPLKDWGGERDAPASVQHNVYNP
ncbi:MAG: hypothetical protein WKG07_20695 [Hymenobacter sp.]